MRICYVVGKSTFMLGSRELMMLGNSDPLSQPIFVKSSRYVPWSELLRGIINESSMKSVPHLKVMATREETYAYQHHQVLHGYDRYHQQLTQLKTAGGEGGEVIRKGF